MPATLYAHEAASWLCSAVVNAGRNAHAAQPTMHSNHALASECCLYCPTEDVVGLHFGEAPSGQTRLFSLGADRRLLEYNLAAAETANAGLRALSVLDVVAPGGAGTPCSMCFAPPMPYYSHASMETLLLVAGAEPGSIGVHGHIVSTFAACGSTKAAALLECVCWLAVAKTVSCIARVYTRMFHADDAYKIKAYNPDAKAASATYLGPTFGGPITKLLPFRYA
jgi:hypothetical protein